MNDSKRETPVSIRLLGGEAAESAFAAIEQVAEEADDLAVERGSDANAQIVIAHGDAADATVHTLHEISGPLSHLALLHPRAAQLSTGSSLAGLKVLITAGATDPDAPPDRTGALADALDAAGAKTEVHWNRGGPETTDEEVAKLVAWLNGARGALADPTALPITREEEGSKGRYLITAPGGIFAEMSYSRVSEKLVIIDHTEVPDAFRGTGTGLRLLKHLIADVRSAGGKIIPLCPYAKAQFDRHAEWADLLETKVRIKPKQSAADR